MATETFRIPFSTFRAFLPVEGERMVVWNGTMNKWPKNKSDFERNETAEVAFGRAIRAQQKHRSGEKSMSPAFEALPGRIHVRGGWAVHKDIPVHNDYFDGTFRADIFVVVRNGHVDTDVQNFNFNWNGSLAAKIIDFTGVIRNIIIGIIRSRVRNQIAQRVRDEVQKEVAKLLKRFPQAQILLPALSVEVEKDQLAITIEYLNLPAVLGEAGVLSGRAGGERVASAVSKAAGARMTSGGARKVGGASVRKRVIGG